jgi:hypothetical protein
MHHARIRNQQTLSVFLEPYSEARVLAMPFGKNTYLTAIYISPGYRD